MIIGPHVCQCTDTCEPEHSHAVKVRAHASESGERATALRSNWHHLGRVQVSACLIPSSLIPGLTTPGHSEQVYEDPGQGCPWKGHLVGGGVSR